MADRRAEEVDDPWGWGRSLEWATSCPSPRHNFVTIPRIRSEAPAFDIHHPEVAQQEVDEHERLGHPEREQFTDAPEQAGRAEHLSQQHDGGSADTGAADNRPGPQSRRWKKMLAPLFVIVAVVGGLLAMLLIGILQYR